MESSALNEVDKELTEVTQWRVLGQNLNVPEHILENIQSNSELTTHFARRRAVLKWWLDNDSNASWNTLAEALDSNHGRLAKSIRCKHNLN